jgi:hypothetical protein
MNYAQILVKHLRQDQLRSSMNDVNRASLRKKNAERREAHKAMGR